MMKVMKPIVIYGVGRSGSSIFHRVFCGHPKVAWLTDWGGALSKSSAAKGLFMSAVDYPFLGRQLGQRLWPSESYDLWDSLFPGFSRPCRDLFAEDVTAKVRERVERALSDVITPKRPRLLLKITGWPRLGFLSSIFGDAKFVHILRDARSVVNSMINVDWWWGWRGPQNWRWGELNASQRQEWEKYGKSFIVLAAIEWKILMDANEEAKKSVDASNLMEVKYEDLCEKPTQVCKDVAEFCGLEWCSEFEKHVIGCSFVNTNYKWQNELTRNQQKILQEVLEEYLKKYGYE